MSILNHRADVARGRLRSPRRKSGVARHGEDGIRFLRLLMTPANAVCDRLGMIDEHERGMMRMLVNMILFTGIVVAVFFVAWLAIA